MLQDTVINEISAHLKCPHEEVAPDMRLDELGIDSLGAITIMYELEDRLDDEIPNDVFEKLTFVSDIVSQLEKILENRKTE